MWGWAGFVIATSSVLTSEKKKNNKFTTFKFDAKLKELNTQLTSAIVQSGPSLHYRTGVLQAFSFATGGFYMVPFLPWFLSSHQQDFLWTASSFDKNTQKMVVSIQHALLVNTSITEVALDAVPNVVRDVI